MRPSTAIRAIVFRVAAIGLGGVMAFGVAELAVRLLAPQETGPVRFAYHRTLRSIPVPGQRGRVTRPGVYAYTFTNDAQGFRVTGAVDRTAARWHVLALGDSFTYGVGVDDDQTFAYLLERNLSQHWQPVTVINAGNGGKGTDYAARFVETVGRMLHPDLVVLGFFPNDFRDNGRELYYRIGEDGGLIPRGTLGSVYARKEPLRRLGLYNWFLSWSQTANLAKQVAIRYIVRQELSGDSVVFYRREGSGYATERSAHATKLLLTRLRAAVNELKSDLVVIYLPSAEDVSARRKGQVSTDEQTLTTLLAGELVSLTPALAESGEPLAALYFDEERSGQPRGHWTPRAHELAAGHIAGIVRMRLERRVSDRPQQASGAYMGRALR